MGTAIALVDWALTQIGTAENPPGSNKVRYWDDVGMHGYQGSPWCAAFYLAGLVATNTKPVTRSVYVPTIRANYQAAGRLRPIAEAEPGDQVLYRGKPFPEGHTGVIVSVDAESKTLMAIEGNTSKTGGGSQWNGGGVYLKQRPWSLTWGCGHPDFASPIVITPFPGDHMRRLDMTERGLDGSGHGYTDLPSVPAFTVVSVQVNTAGYAPVPQCVGDEDYAGHARLEWVGPANAPAFGFRVWVTE